MDNIGLVGRVDGGFAQEQRNELVLKLQHLMVEYQIDSIHVCWARPWVSAQVVPEMMSQAAAPPEEAWACKGCGVANVAARASCRSCAQPKVPTSAPSLKPEGDDFDVELDIAAHTQADAPCAPKHITVLNPKEWCCYNCGAAPGAGGMIMVRRADGVRADCNLYHLGDELACEKCRTNLGRAELAARGVIKRRQMVAANVQNAVRKTQ